MKRTTSFGAVLFLVGCGGNAEAPTATPSPGPILAPAYATVAVSAQPALIAAAPHWSYAGEAGPSHWSEIAPEFAACKTGRKQTPIDLSTKAPRGPRFEPLGFAYAPIPLSIQNNGHTVQVTNTVAATLAAGGQRFDLAQFHAHVPSEHTIDGTRFDLELHLVHKSAKGEIVVVGLLFKRGKENAALAPYFDRAPADVAAAPSLVANVAIDVRPLLSDRARYWTYAGSLTTPPCSENVTWYVLGEPLEVSAAQLAKLRTALHGDNARPVQPPGDRPVFQYSP